MNASGSRSAQRRERGRREGVHGPAMPLDQKPPPGVAGDILREAWRPGVGEPVTIHVRPAVLARILGETGARGVTNPTAGGRRTIPFVVDDQIPAAPGYEIHRDIDSRRTARLRADTAARRPLSVTNS